MILEKSTHFEKVSKHFLRRHRHRFVSSASHMRCTCPRCLHSPHATSHVCPRTCVISLIPGLYTCVNTLTSRSRAKLTTHCPHTQPTFPVPTRSLRKPCLRGSVPGAARWGSAVPTLTPKRYPGAQMVGIPQMYCVMLCHVWGSAASRSTLASNQADSRCRRC